MEKHTAAALIDYLFIYFFFKVTPVICYSCKEGVAATTQRMSHWVKCFIFLVNEVQQNLSLTLPVFHLNSSKSVLQ